MENNKFWIYLVLGVVAALSLKWFNSDDHSVASNRWSIRANMAEEIQYNRSARSNDKVAGLTADHSTSRRRTTPLLANVKSGATTAAPASAAKKDVKLQNVAKKKDDKKKKKKKKPKVLPLPGNESAADEDDEALDARNVPAAGSAAPLAFAGAQASPAAPPTLLSDWERLLLGTPNHRETIRFIGLYQTKQVTAEVFYGIVSQMLNDGRTQMRQLGVMSLAATPSLHSYEMLVATNDNETGVVKTQATRYLDETYNRPEAIKYLYEALTHEVSSATQLQALKNLSALVTNLRQPNRQTSSQPDASAADPTATTTAAPSKSELVTRERVMKYLVQLQNVVMPALAQSPDQQVRELAVRVNGQLSVALNSATQPVQTASN